MNTFRVMYGLCKRYEIETEGKTPKELWREIHEAEERKKRETAKRMGVEVESDDKTLTDEEEAAIVRYTGSKSYLLNEALRSGEKLSPEYKKWAKSLNSAIRKLPKYKGTVTRSVWLQNEEALRAFLDEYKVGQIVTCRSFLSTTKGGIYNTEANVQITILNSRKGADISEYYDGEREVLYGTETKMKVLKISKAGDTYYLTLEEV